MFLFTPNNSSPLPFAYLATSIKISSGLLSTFSFLLSLLTYLLSDTMNSKCLGYKISGMIDTVLSLSPKICIGTLLSSHVGIMVKD